MSADKATLKLGREVSITDGPILKNFILYTIPLILTSLLQIAYNAVDIMVLGNFAGEEFVAPVGAVTPIVNILILFSHVHTGYGMLIGRYFGEENGDKIKSTNSTALIFALTIGVVSGVVGWMLAEPILRLTGCPEGVIGDAVTYLRIYVLSLPGTMFYSFFSHLLRSSGDSKTPLYILFVSGACNVALNLLFVLVFKMPVAGVAIGTSASIYISAILLFIKLIRMEGLSRLELSGIRFSLPDFGKIIRYGLPNAISASTFGIANLLIQSAVNAYGDLAIAGAAAAVTIEGILFGVSNSISTATSTFISQNIGAENKDRVLRIRRLVHILSLGTLLALSLLTMALGRQLLGLFLPDGGESLDFGYTRLLFVAVAVIIHAVICVNNGVLISFGYSTFQMLHNLVGVVLFRTVWMLFIYPQNKTPNNLFLCYPVSFVITAAIGFAMCCYIIRKYKSGERFAV